MAIDNKKDSLPDLESAVQEYLDKGNPESKEKLLKIGRDIATYYAGIYSHDKSDNKLIRAANEGFILALKNYDSERGVLFSTYAIHCIINEIRQELRSRNIFKIPDWLKKLQDDVINATEELAQKKAALPTLKEIAGKVNIAEQGILETMQAGSVPMKDVNLSSIRSLKRESFKLPIEDVITIRKSIDRLSNIQKKVLSLISVNLRELSLAIEEEESALTKSQVEYLRATEDCTGDLDAMDRNCHIPINSFKIAFPEEYEEAEVLRYFEVLSDEFGLRLSEIRCKGKPEENGEMVEVPLDILLEGRYRGLLQLLDHLRNAEENVIIEKVRTTRNEQVPARISIMIEALTQFQKA
ncbi:MAG: hypothetical protein SCJ97_10085 [Bacillota bacterium]|nr:hypothetical protein [Bacillota bacterium]